MIRCVLTAARPTTHSYRAPPLHEQQLPRRNFEPRGAIGPLNKRPLHDAHTRFMNWAPHPLYHTPRVNMDKVEVDEDWKTELANLQGRNGEDAIVPGTREYWRARTQSDLLSRLSRGYWSQPHRETPWTVAPDDPSVHQQTPAPGLTQSERQRYRPLDQRRPRRAPEAIDPCTRLTSGPKKSPKSLIAEQLRSRQRDLMLAQQTPPSLHSVPPTARPDDLASPTSSGEWTSTSSDAHTSDFFDTDDETDPPPTENTDRTNQALSPGLTQPFSASRSVKDDHSSSHTMIGSIETDESEPSHDTNRRRSSQIGPLDTSRNANTRPRPPLSEPTGLFGLPISELEELMRGAYQGPQDGPSGLSEAQRRQDSQAQEHEREIDVEKEI
ncbi:hypothetical protein DOTSEDRAFT_74587 [Dothistroma septosporum NZE10]|uniref:Uncharacterized protein n=1 Tax=Dothistroma septosporum (strain NZE10 / CBS 128990) TaxID=675120 RepID=N1PEQ8_DOTSN|nr:hypothetical protein DOTSEDRAFT_74587 [Dothistroma septosporum NZE10]